MKKSELTEIIREVIKETIRKVDGKYVVYPERGGKRLGTHSTKKAAEKQLTAIHLNKEAVDTDNLTVLSVIDGGRNLDNEHLRKLFADSVGTFYIYTNEEGEYENTKKISKQDAYKYVDYYNARLKGNKDREVKLGAELGVLGIESELQFKIGELSADPSTFSANEGDHKPMNPGILKNRLGKLSCSKVRTAKGKLKDKGTTYAKALQRYLNYHCQ